jgi:hypothetical protein
MGLLRQYRRTLDRVNGAPRRLAAGHSSELPGGSRGASF